jgi:inner membrane protein
MTLISHTLIAVAPTVIINPILIAAVLAGSVAPDMLERFLNVKHRQETHILIYWLAGAALGAVVALMWGGVFSHVAAFAFGGLSHVLLDSLTPSGVPLSPLSANRVHFFGGRVITGSPTEYAITACVVALCLVFGGLSGGFDWLPFGWDYGGYYRKGLIDGHEWRLNRFRFF